VTNKNKVLRSGIWTWYLISEQIVRNLTAGRQSLELLSVMCMACFEMLLSRV